MRIYIILMLFLCSLTGVAQHLKVIDQDNGQPIEDAFIQIGQHHFFTNKKGEVKLSNTIGQSSLEISNIGYKPQVILLKDLKQEQLNVIKLQSNTLNLHEVVISSNKRVSKEKDIPQEVAHISKPSVELFQPQTAADLLQISNEVFIQKSQLGGGSPMIRGFSANRILLVVDNIRMNNAIFRSGNLQNVISLDALSIAKTEVIFGPGSVIYGSDALGGVMNFSTLKPQFSPTDKCLLGGTAYTRFSTANQEKTLHLDFNAGGKKWAYLGSFSYNHFGDLKMGNTKDTTMLKREYVERINGIDSVLTNKSPRVQKNSGYQQLNTMHKFKYQFNKHWNMEYAFHFSRLSEVPRYDRSLVYKKDKPKYAEWYYGAQKWTMNALNISYLKHHLLFDKLKVVAAFQNYEESRNDRKFNNKQLRTRTENVDLITLNIDADKFINHKNDLFYGIELSHNSVHSKGIKTNIQNQSVKEIGSRYPDGSTLSNMAVYAHYLYKPSPRWIVNTGLRYSHIILNADFNSKFYKFPFEKARLNTGNLTGSLGAVYHIDETFDVKSNFSTGYRSPNIDDIGKVFDSEAGHVIVPNPNLKPEYAYNIDLGFSKRFGEIIHINLTAYYSLLDQAMVRRNFTFNGQDSIIYDGENSKVEALVNTNKAYIYGFQTEFLTKINQHWSIKLFFNYMKGKDSDNMPIRHISPMFGSAQLSFKNKHFKAILYGVFNGEISNDNLATSEQKKTYMYAKDSKGKPYSPAWATLNFKCHYYINSHFSLSGGIENIFDKAYRPYSSGIVAPGRNFILSFKAHF